MYRLGAAVVLMFATAFSVSTSYAQAVMSQETDKSEIAAGTGIVPPAIRERIQAYTNQRPGTALEPLHAGSKLHRVPTILIEQALASLGYDVGLVDGLVTPETRSAIAAYEVRRGLPVTGKITPPLIAALEAGG